MAKKRTIRAKAKKAGGYPRAKASTKPDRTRVRVLGYRKAPPAGELIEYAAKKGLPSDLQGIVSSTGSFFGSYGGRFRFTPSPYNPDDLVQRKGIKIYRKMAQDEQVKAALSAKKYAVLSTGYEVQLPELPEGEGAEDDEENLAAQEHKEFLEFNFEEMKGSFDSKLLDIMSALTFGFSVSEKIFWSIDYGDFEGKWGLKDLRTRPPDDIEFGVDSYGDLAEDGVWQNGLPLPAAKFLIYSYRNEFGNYYGDSDLRAAYRAYWSKDNMLKLMAVSLERYGEPVAVATYEGLLTLEQRADIESFLKNLQSRSGILLPKNITLEFKMPPPRAAEAFIPAVNLYDQHIRIAILMPGLMGLSGEQATGSFARAVKEFDVFLWILGQLRRDIETVVNEQLVKPLLDLNYKIEHGMYPKFKFKEVTEEARQRQFELFLMGLGAGALNKGPEDENKLRELINFEPLPEDFVPPDPMTGLPGGEGLPLEEEELEAAVEGEDEGEEEEFDFSSDYAVWDEEKHPRHEKGGSDGGKFAPVDGEKGGGRSNKRATKGKLPPKTSIGDKVTVKLKSGRVITGLVDTVAVNTPQGPFGITETNSNKLAIVGAAGNRIEINKADIDLAWRLNRAQKEFSFDFSDEREAALIEYINGLRNGKALKEE